MINGDYLFLLGGTFCLFAVGLVSILRKTSFFSGILLIWMGITLFEILTDFRYVAFSTFLLVTLLTFLTQGMDWLGSATRIQKFRVSRGGITGTILGMIVGVSVGGFLGLVAGTILGSIGGEFASRKGRLQDFFIGKRAAMEFVSGKIVQFILGFLLIGIFLWEIL